MRGEVEVPARIALRTDLASGPGGLDEVQVEGAFDDPTANPWTLDPRIRVGESLRVSRPDARLRWSDPGIIVSDCRLPER